MKTLNRFRRDKRGAIYAWIIVLIFMFTYATVWFTAGWAAMQVVDTVESQTEFGDEATGVIDFLRNVFAWHPILVFVGLILYALVNSQRRDVRIDF